MRALLPTSLLAITVSLAAPLHADNPTEQNYQRLQQQIQQLQKNNNAQLAQLKAGIEAQLQQLEKEIQQLGSTNQKMLQNLKSNFESQLQQTQKNTEQQIMALKKQMDAALSKKH